MCQYSADDGALTDWHFVHIGGFAARGVAAITIEATAVVPEGRISPEDSGLWNDAQIAPLKRIANFVHSQGAHLGVQLAHAGRKASTYAPWVNTDILGQPLGGDLNGTASASENGWPDEVYGPSEIPFNQHYPKPKALTVEQIHALTRKFVDSAERAKAANCKFSECYIR